MLFFLWRKKGKGWCLFTIYQICLSWTSVPLFIQFLLELHVVWITKRFSLLLKGSVIKWTTNYIWSYPNIFHICKNNSICQLLLHNMLNNTYVFMNKTRAVLVHSTKETNQTKPNQPKSQRPSHVKSERNRKGKAKNATTETSLTWRSKRNGIKIWALMGWWMRKAPALFIFLGLPFKGPKECKYPVNIFSSDFPFKCGISESDF